MSHVEKTQRSATPGDLVEKLRPRLTAAYHATIRQDDGAEFDIQPDNLTFHETLAKYDRVRREYVVRLGHWDTDPFLKEAREFLNGKRDLEDTEMGQGKTGYHYDQMAFCVHAYDTCKHPSKAMQRKYGITHRDGGAESIFDGDDGACGFQEYRSPSLEKLLTYLNEQILAPDAQIDLAPFRQRGGK